MGKKGKLWPSANQKPVNWSTPNLNGVIMSQTPTTKKLGSIRPGVFAPHIGEMYTPPGSWTRLQASPLDRFLRLIRQMTRFCAIECCQSHFSLTDPRGHGNEILAKIGYNSACVRNFCEIFAPIGRFSLMGHRMLPMAFSPDRPPSLHRFDKTAWDRLTDRRTPQL